MAQTKRKRTRKHRGNAAGIVERPAHNSRAAPASAAGKGRSTSKEEARRKRQARFNRPPTWKNATQRAGIAAALFAVLITVFFKQNPATTIPLALFMLVLYIPLSYATDRAVYNWRQKKGAIPPG
jgi:hypothetical protein